MTDSPESKPRLDLARLVDKALSINQPAVDAYVKKLRGWTTENRRSRVHRGQPAAALRAADNQYRSAVTAMGAGAGASAAIPGIGTGAAIALSAVEMGTNLEATALYVLTYATIHGVDVDEMERRRTLFYAVLMGNAGAAAVEKAVGRTAPYWAKSLINNISMDTIKAINKVLGPRFITKYGTKQGVLVLGRTVPLGIGAALGGGGNLIFGELTVRAAHRAFGPAPERWRDEESLLDDGPEQAEPAADPRA